MNITTGTLAASNLVYAILVSDLLEVLNDDVVRLIPGDALKLILATIGLCALHGILQTLRAVHIIRNTQATAA